MDTATIKKHHVYVVTHVSTTRHYVGKTSKNPPKRRWGEHISTARRGDEDCVHFHRALAKYGPDAFMWQVIESFDTEAEALEAEAFWIEFLNATHREYGFNICTFGLGSSGTTISEEHRRKISEANRSRVYTPEMRRRMSESRTGRAVSDETRQRLSNSLRGREFSPEHRRRLSEAGRRREYSQETRQRMSEAHRGIKPSPETIEKQRAVKLGKKHSPETRQKISASTRGLKRSPEACKNIREAAQRRSAARKVKA